MKTIESTLRKESFQLEKIIKDAKARLAMAPKGHIRISKKRGRVEYYYKNADDNGKKGKRDNGKYMKKGEDKLIEEIVQKDYDICLVKNAEVRLKAIHSFLEKYKRTNIKAIYQKMNPYRKELLTESIISDEEYINRWLAVEYKGKSFDDNAQEIVTERGECVRSKSEKIIADKLYALGIPYRYEYPLEIERNITLYPDFTILRMPEREEVYLEHFGMMDDSNYVEKVINKLNTYERNGIYLGVNLFITYETGKRTLNTRCLDGLIRKLFCVE